MSVARCESVRCMLRVYNGSDVAVMRIENSSDNRFVQVVTTISRGRLAWHNNEFLLSPGSSRFISTPPGGPLFHGLDKQDGAKTMHPASLNRLHHTQPLLQSIDSHEEL